MSERKRQGRRQGPRGMTVPPALGPGDVVGVVAPGFAVDRRRVERGIHVLEELGLKVRPGRALFAREGSFAGSDGERLRDLVRMLEDDEVRAIHFARGGWGTSRILDGVPWELLRRRPKLLIGYSDLTSLFAGVLERSGLVCVYGPVLSELGDSRRFHRASLLRALFDPRGPLSIRVKPRDVLVPGRASGRAAGGCLTLLTHLAGTPYAQRFAGRILLIEEIREAPYRIDRMLTQLRLAGALAGVKGVLVGSLTGCAPMPGSGPSPTAREVIVSLFRPAGVPVVAGLRFGHAPAKLSIPLGFRAVIDTAAGRVTFAP